MELKLHDPLCLQDVCGGKFIIFAERLLFQPIKLIWLL